MSKPDFNLLITLDALLDEGSVVKAAKRLHLSPSAMSRALARLRETTGDPLLVRAGRGLVPTPRARELRDQVGPLVQRVEAALRPAETLKLGELVRMFTLRASDGFVDNFGAAIIARVSKEAPGARLRFIQKPDKESTPLREGSVDLEIGVVGNITSPELRVQSLYQDSFVCVMRKNHALSKGKITLMRYIASEHVSISRRGFEQGPIDDTLQSLGLRREIKTTVSGFASALALTRSTELVATVPARHTGNLRSRSHSAPLPFDVPKIVVSMIWHPRMDADPAHRWLRGCVRAICAT